MNRTPGERSKSAGRNRRYHRRGQTNSALLCALLGLVAVTPAWGQDCGNQGVVDACKALCTFTGDACGALCGAVVDTCKAGCTGVFETCDLGCDACDTVCDGCCFLGVCPEGCGSCRSGCSSCHSGCSSVRTSCNNGCNLNCSDCVLSCESDCDALCTPPCGGDGERACCLIPFERLPSCDAGLVESGSCTGTLGTGNCGLGDCSLAMCVDPQCGALGERACCLDEHIPSCDSGLVEDITADGACSTVLGSENCDCLGLLSALGPPSQGTCQPPKKVGQLCNLIWTACETGLLCMPVEVEIGGDMRCFPIPSNPAEFLTTAVCQSMHIPYIHQQAISQGRTISYGAGGGAAAIVGTSIEVGVAYGRDGCFGCYMTGCIGGETDINVNVYAATGHFNVNLQCESRKICSNDPDRFCVTGADCSGGATCDGAKICANDRTQLCTSDSHCPTAGMCFQGGGFCVGSPSPFPCDSNSDCGLIGLCIGDDVCLNDDDIFPAECSSDDDCATSGACQDCLSFDGWSCANEIGGSIPILEIGLGAVITWVNCDTCMLPPLGIPSDIPPWEGSDCEIVGGAGLVSIGVGLLPAGVGGAWCNTFVLPAGCVDASGNLPPLPISSPPSCNTGGPYSVECAGNTTQINMLNGSIDPDGDTMQHTWQTNCDGTFDNPLSTSPTLTLNAPVTCPTTCDVVLTVSDGSNVVPCQSTVTIDDTANPSISPSASDSTVECDPSVNTAALNSWLAGNGGAVASDTCDDSLTWSNSSSGLSDLCGATGAETVTFTATDDCGNPSNTAATFTIADTTDPTIACPANIFRESSVGQCWLDVTYPVAVTASDDCGLDTLSCVDQNNNSVGTVSDNFPVGTTTVTCTATDDCSRTSACSFDVVVNDPPTIVSVTPATQMVQYSDMIVPVVVTATDCGPEDFLTLEFDPAEVPNALALSSTADSCGVNGAGLIECTWTLENDDRVLEPEGDYAMDGIKAVDPVQLNGAWLKSDPAETITVQVKAENATITFDSANPVAVQVATDGGDSGSFSLSVDVQELLPELVTAGGNLPGDIGLAVMSMTLAPVGPGGPAVGTCTPDNDPSAFVYSGELTVTCAFDNVGVNTYTVEAVLVANGAGELFYTGSNEDVLVVFDPSLGFTTGGGWFHWPGSEDPSIEYPGDRTSWGYTMKYNKKRTRIQGSLLLIRHLPDGSKYRIKSNALFGLAIGDEDGYGWASFAGKCTYKDPSMVEPVGNHQFVTYVEDHGEPGAGVDRFWLQVFDKDDDLIADLSMDETAVSNAETIVGGNIVVPHKTRGTR